MQRNVGGIDRVLRIVVGFALLSLVLVLDAPARWFGLVGLIPLFTAAVGWCPLYPLLGVSTCHPKTLS